MAEPPRCPTRPPTHTITHPHCVPSCPSRATCPQGHPEATDGAAGRSVAEAFMYHAADGIQAGLDAGQVPSSLAGWIGLQAGRMEAAYRQYSDADMMESYAQLSELCKAFLNA